MRPERITHPIAQYTLHHIQTSHTQKANFVIGHTTCNRAIIWNFFRDLKSESILEDKNQKIIEIPVMITSQILSIHKKSCMIKLDKQ